MTDVLYWVGTDRLRPIFDFRFTHVDLRQSMHQRQVKIITDMSRLGSLFLSVLNRNISDFYHGVALSRASIPFFIDAFTVYDIIGPGALLHLPCAILSGEQLV
jgi:hypothetical protein